MNVVYKIKNLINQKIYIGSSVRVEKRWQQHKNNAFNPNSDSYNYPLQAALRKYGIENFSFEIIKNDFTTVEDMQNYEKDMILKYHSLTPNGYNQTLETSNNNIAKENMKKHIQKVSQLCALVDKNENILEIYQSYHAAARAQGWDGDDRASTIKKICEGEVRSCAGLIFRKLDENNEVIIPKFKTQKRRQKVIGIKINDPTDIVYYNSVSEAGRHESVSRSAISKCINDKTGKYNKSVGRIWMKGDD